MVGVLPLHLAALAAAVVVPVLELRPEDRGKELNLEETRERFRGLQTYRVFPAETLRAAEAELRETLKDLQWEGWNGFGFTVPALERILWTPETEVISHA